MRKWIGGALGRRQQLVNNLSRGRFADGAIAVPDPALRERVLAPAGARLGVEFVKRDGSLLRRQLGQIDTGKLHGAVSVLQEICPGTSKVSTFTLPIGKPSNQPISTS